MQTLVTCPVWGDATNLVEVRSQVLWLSWDIYGWSFSCFIKWSFSGCHFWVLFFISVFRVISSKTFVFINFFVFGVISGVSVPPANFTLFVFTSRSGNSAAHSLGLLRFRGIAHSSVLARQYRSIWRLLQLLQCASKIQAF